jgi:recombination protein RecA
MLFGDKPNTGYQTVSTGSISLNRALGIGGLPRGRIIEIFGWESCGKTTIALHSIADAQKQGLRCLLVDAENAFDPEYADSLGVNVDELLYCQPSYGEQGLEVADNLMCSGKVDVVVIDSVAALIPKAELEGEHGDNKMGLHARLMSQACRKIVGTVAKHNVLCIFINQFRHKIGVMFGNPEVTTGGNALQFYSSIRLEVRRSTTNQNSIMNGDIKEGNQTTVRVIKNKCAPPFRVAQFDIMYGTGVDTIGEVVTVGCELGIIQKAGSWFSYNEDKLGQGADSVRQMLVDNEELKEEILLKIKQHPM